MPPRYDDDKGSSAATKNTEAGAIAAILERYQQPTLLDVSRLDVPVIVLPKTGEVKSLEHLMAYPRRIRSQVTVRDHQSFIEYVTRHKGPGTIIFAEVKETGGSFTAILDYHLPNHPEARASAMEVAGITGAARWSEHACKFVCEFTPEWKRWRDLSGKCQAQAAFALFVEENMFDIATPEPAKMLEIVKTLEATQGAKFKSGLRLDNGDRSFSYTQQTEGRAGAQGDIEIPQKFRLRFAVFTNGPAYDIDCRFRWNVDNGDLRLGFEIEKPHKVIELALTEAHLAIKEALQLPVLLGDVGLGQF